MQRTSLSAYLLILAVILYFTAALLKTFVAEKQLRALTSDMRSSGGGLVDARSGLVEDMCPFWAER